MSDINRKLRDAAREFEAIAAAKLKLAREISQERFHAEHANQPPAVPPRPLGQHERLARAYREMVPHAEQGRLIVFSALKDDPEFLERFGALMAEAKAAGKYLDGHW